MGCSFSRLNALYDVMNGGGDVWINDNRFRIVKFWYLYLWKNEADYDDGTYAMKKVLIQNSEQLELVREEIRVSSLFSHPNLFPLLDHAIISIKDHGIMKHIYYFLFIWMEFYWTIPLPRELEKSYFLPRLFFKYSDRIMYEPTYLDIGEGITNRIPPTYYKLALPLNLKLF
ncbi:hypothetical protein V6N13_126720 [Hibiscus sabdariffa]